MKPIKHNGCRLLDAASPGGGDTQSRDRQLSINAGFVVWLFLPLGCYRIRVGENKMKHLLSSVWLILCVMVGGCAHLGAKLEEPRIRVESIQVLESRGLSQRFRVGLRVINPNDRVLPVKGLSYSLSLNGYDMLDGVTNRVPTLEPFSETLVEVETATDLVGALRFLNDLVQNSDLQHLTYTLTADVSVQGWMGKITVKESGEVPLLGKVAAP